MLKDTDVAYKLNSQIRDAYVSLDSLIKSNIDVVDSSSVFTVSEAYSAFLDGVKERNPNLLAFIEMGIEKLALLLYCHNVSYVYVLEFVSVAVAKNLPNVKYMAVEKNVFNSVNNVFQDIIYKLDTQEAKGTTINA